MVYKSVDKKKTVVDLFFTITFIFFTKNQKQNNRHCLTCYIVSMVYPLIDLSSRPRARILSVIVTKKLTCDKDSDIFCTHLVVNEKY